MVETTNRERLHLKIIVNGQGSKLFVNKIYDIEKHIHHTAQYFVYCYYLTRYITLFLHTQTLPQVLTVCQNVLIEVTIGFFSLIYHMRPLFILKMSMGLAHCLGHDV